MKDDALLAWVIEHLHEPGLPDLLNILKQRRGGFIPAALQLGDTNEHKTRIDELSFIINLVENFQEYIADTGTETAEG
jgi:hypothetical protein